MNIILKGKDSDILSDLAITVMIYKSTKHVTMRYEPIITDEDKN